MARGDRSHSRASRRRPTGRWLRRTSAALVVVVLAASAASYQLDLGTRWFGWDYPSPIDEPAAVAPPPGLSLPRSEPAPEVATATEPVEADPGKVRRALEDLVDDEDLGRRVAVAVGQLADGASVYETGPGRVTPASTMKIVTAVAALASLGPAHRFRTTVASATAASGAPTSRIVLVGGGDPFLGRAPVDPAETYPARADIETLAVATAQALKAAGRARVRLGYDTSLFQGPQVSPDWPASYIPDDVVSPISPLWVDEGRERTGLVFRSEDPAAAAAGLFAAELEKRGIKVRGRPAQTTTDPEATELAAVESAPLRQVVQRVLEFSDNEAAEVLFRHVAIAEGQPVSFDGASRAVRAVLDRLGIDTSGDRIVDGSGLSRKNRLNPDTLLSLLEVAADEDHPELRSAVANLPVAGFTGSLADRFETGDDDGLGRVRAKTGTLTGVHGLAGYVTDLDGTVLEFVAIADRVRLRDTLDARATLDEIAAALAGCHCAAG